MSKSDEKKNWSFTMVDNAIIYNSQLSINEKFVYIVLCSHKNIKTNQCYPSIRRIAALSCCSANTVRKALKSLKEKGLISISERKVDKVNCSNLYTILEIPQSILDEYTQESSSKNDEQVLKDLKGATSEYEGQVLKDFNEGTSEYDGQVAKGLKGCTLKYDVQVAKDLKEGTSEFGDKLNKHKDINDEQNNVTIYDKSDNVTIYKSIVDYLNKKANTNYKSTTKKTRELISARLREGFTLEDFYTVIDKKCDDWINTEFERFLRPTTIFGTKFENYLNQKGKRRCEDYGKYQYYNAREFKRQGIGL